MLDLSLLALSLQPGAEKEKQVFTSKGIKGGLLGDEGFWGRVGRGWEHPGLVEDEGGGTR